MHSPTPLTALDAVNELLQATGESRVLELTDDLEEVVVAQSTLNNVLLEVLNHGWSFNTETMLLELETGTCRIKLPENTLTVDPEDRFLKVVQRGLYLYDLTNNTYTFNSPLRCHLVVSLPFECLPPHARMYITARAGKRYVEAMVGAETYSRFSSQYELDCWRLFRRVEGQVGDYNILTGSQGTQRILDRYPRSRRNR